MATWGQVTLLLKTVYDVLRDSTDSLDVQVPAGDGRTQVVTVRYVDQGDDNGSWVVKSKHSTMPRSVSGS